MQLFNATQKPESATVSPAALRNLDDFASCSEAAARLSELLQQQNELEVQLAAATRRMYEICQDKPIPPRDHDREVNELSQRLAKVKAEIPPGPCGRCRRSFAVRSVSEPSFGGYVIWRL